MGVVLLVPWVEPAASPQRGAAKCARDAHNRRGRIALPINAFTIDE
jgi:hypothetical protein